MVKVLGLGDNVVDKYMHISTMYPGGNALNFSVYAKLFGNEAAYMGVFGDDEAARHVYNSVKGIGVDMSRCRFSRGENGYAEVRIENGDRIFIGSNGGGVSKEYPLILTKLDKQYISGFDIVHTSIFSSIENELPVIREVSAFVSMDFSDRKDEEYFKKCAPYIDCACISCGDMKEEDILEHIHKLKSFGCRHMVIATRGARGAFVMVDGKCYEQSPCLIEAVDTMGAGDSFITCFLINYIGDMKYATEFPELSGRKGLTTAEEYKDAVIKTSLYKAAVYSAQNCMKDGSFGYGKQFTE